MTMTNAFSRSLIAVALLLVGCEQPGKSTNPPTKKDGPATNPEKKDVAAKTEKKAGSKSPDHDHDHDHGNGPNGGLVFDLGKHHAEFTVDHPGKSCTIILLKGDAKTPVAAAATELTLVTKPTSTKEGKAVPAMTIKMLPQNAVDGKASKFVGTDPGLGNVADFAGTVLGELDGKPSSGEFEE